MQSPATVAAIRFGYGFSPSQKPPTTPEGLLAQLDGAEVPAFPVEGVAGRRQRIIAIDQDLREISQKVKMMAASDGNAARAEISRGVAGQFALDSKRRLFQAASSPRGFHERLAGFWTNHFSVSAAKSMPMRLWAPLYEAEALRPNMTGAFSDLLIAATTHPAMLIYLDQIQSFGPDAPLSQKNTKGLNENLARELLELHSLGAGSGYNQTDVRSTALLLTGLAIDNGSAMMAFRPALAEPGSQTILGRNYGSTPRRPADYVQLLEDLAHDPRTARHICRKLAIHFLSDNPPDAVVADMQEAWRGSGGNLKSVYGAMLHNKQSWELPALKARQPFDYIAATLRAVDAPNNPDVAASFMVAQADTADAQRRERVLLRRGDQGPIATASLALASLDKMGQPSWMPLSPAGFDEAFASWITAAQLSARIGWAQTLAGRVGDRLDARALLARADWLAPATGKILLQAPSTTAAIAMFFASPDFNRR